MSMVMRMTMMAVTINIKTSLRMMTVMAIKMTKAKRMLVMTVAITG